MSNRNRKKVELPSNALGASILGYLKALETKHFSADTISVRRRHLSYFAEWCLDRSVEIPNEVERAIIERYQRHLFHYKKEDGKPLAIVTQHGRLQAIRAYFTYLSKRHFIPYNPAADIELPRKSQKIPPQPLSADEVESIMKQPDLKTPEGRRDRAILEILYSTGIRRAEVLGLTIYDIDFDRGILIVKEGKGRKDRVVPIGQRALDSIRDYMQLARDELLTNQADTILFPGRNGQPMQRNNITDRLRKYIKAAGVDKKGACHIFRHTTATLMLENGADVRFVQEMLGHANLNTTQIYTRVSVKKLKAVHELTHPSANIAPSKSTQKSEKDEPDQKSGDST